MGAYENPAQLVDTQTGQHFRNLQATIASSFSSYAESYAVKQQEIKRQLDLNKKKIDEIKRETEEYEFEVRNTIGKITPVDSKINMAETFEPLVQEAVKLKSGLLNNTISGKERQVAMQKLADINNTISGDFTSNLTSFTGWGEDVNKAFIRGTGVVGGLAKDQNPEDIRALQIMQGKLKGEVKAVYENADPKKLLWKVYDDKGVEVRSYDAAKINKIDTSDNEYIRVVPDTSVNNEMVKANNNTIFKVEEVKPGKFQATGEITDAYLRKKDGKIEVKKEYIPGTNTYKTLAKVDIDQIKASPVMQQVRGQAIGMSDTELILHINNTVNADRERRGLKPVYLDADNVLDEREKAEALDAYVDNFFTTQIPEWQPITKPDSDIILQEDVTQKVKAKSVPKEKTIKPKFTDVSKLIWEQEEGSADDFTWGNKKVSYDGAVFTIASGPNKGIAFNTKKEVIEYLKTGKIK